jgi:dTDP-4-amino-4,6-dideoxygalactose transaminase
MSKLAILGGEKTCNSAWPEWPVWDDNERDQLLGVLESGQWWYGEKVAQFERDYAELQGCRLAVSTNSGTTALEIAFRALGVGPGDEVIVPAYTFIATATSVVFAGAKPVFADINPDDLCIDAADVARKVTSRTKAIVPVHFAGHVAAMDKLQELADKYKLIVVEDACHSWGGQWNGQGTGSLGRCGVFSFQASKNISSGEGGIITTNDQRLADCCRSLTNCGRVKGGKWYEHGQVGTNVRLTEFQAGILLAQMKRVASHRSKRAAAAAILDQELGQIPGLRPLTNDPRNTRRTYHLYCFWFDPQTWEISRDQFVDALNAEGIPASSGYLSPVYANLCFQPGDKTADNPTIRRPAKGSDLDYSRTRCPVAKETCKNIVWLTQSVLLADEDHIRMISLAIWKIYRSRTTLQRNELAGVQ